MFIGIISLFPEMFNIIIKYGVISRAIKKGLLNIKFWNPRNYTYDIHHSVDDKPYGGGVGMLMMVQPLMDAIHAAKYEIGKNVKVVYLSPQGRKFSYKNINEIIINKKIILVCGRYEGIDERVNKFLIDEEWSIGDFVLSGGELPAMIIIDSISRFIPGVLGNYLSVIEDSFVTGLLDYPHYTKPKIFNNMEVPHVLLSGNHTKIDHWRRKQSLGRTWIRRPDLLENFVLTEEQKKILIEFQLEYKNNNILD